MRPVDLTQLEEHFAIPGVLGFRQTPTGLIYLEATTAAATATVFLHGAHLTHWLPAGKKPVLYLSKRTELAAWVPIRGGVPIIFPWFGADKKTDRVDGKPGSAHGFARIEEWTLAFAAMAGDDLHLSFTLGPTAESRKMGFDKFRVAFQLTIGRTLTMRLTVANDAETPLVFEEALHTYFAVADTDATTVTGLEGAAYVDKTQNFAVMPGVATPIAFTAETDRLYNHTEATCVIHDAAGKRRIVVEKANSATTVVWNPRKAMPDLGAEEWREMVCVETANAGETQITLKTGEAHTMQAVVSVEAFVSAEAGQ
jgi:glucose-6-phosphate 1-epimerase